MCPGPTPLKALVQAAELIGMRVLSNCAVRPSDTNRARFGKRPEAKRGSINSNPAPSQPITRTLLLEWSVASPVQAPKRGNSTRKCQRER